MREQGQAFGVCLASKVSYKLKFDLQPGSSTVQVAGEHQP